jgi:predicted MFS family arabinose efflux permease
MSMGQKTESLWRNGDFLKLWSAHTISQVGSKITFLALPLTAVVVLDATPLQMGYLSVAGSLPALLFGLLAGVWVDRHNRRPLLIGADVALGGVLLAIPFAAWSGVLNMGLLYGVVFASGLFGLVASVAYRSYLTGLVLRPQLVAANSRLEMSRSAAEVAGPGLGGWLIQVLGAPFAILLDAISYLLSALLLLLIRRPESPPSQTAQGEGIGQQIGAGLRFVGRNQTLRALLGCTATVSFFNAALETVYLLYMTHNLGLSAGQIGIIFGAGSVGFLLGALLPERTERTFGFGPTLITGLVILALADLALPLVAGPIWLIVGVLMVAQLCFGLGLTLYNVGQVSLRQTLTPDTLQGRMNASFDFAVAGLVPLGALAGGLLGELIGIRTVLILAAAGELLAVVWLLWSPATGAPWARRSLMAGEEG